MSIITTAPAVPSRVFAIYSSLIPSANGETKDRLESWATPLAIRTRGSASEGSERSTELFSSALREAKSLGLVEEEGDRIKMTAEARGSDSKIDPEFRFKEHMSKVLFDPSRAESAQQAAFSLALSWFLSRNPLQPMEFGASFQNDLARSLGDNAPRTELTAINRFQNFIYWARYLGFAAIVGTKEARWVLPDAFPVISAAVPRIFRDAGELPIDLFMTSLANLYPVFEGGVTRLATEELSVSPEVESGGRKLSIATSMALHRLQTSNLVSLAVRADAPAAILNLGEADRRVSHILRKAE